MAWHSNLLQPPAWREKADAFETENGPYSLLFSSVVISEFMIGLKPDSDRRPEPMGSEALSYCCVQPAPTQLISSYLLFEERTKQKLRFFLNFVCIVLCCFIRDCLPGNMSSPFAYRLCSIWTSIFTHFNHSDFHKLKLSFFGFGDPELSEAELKKNAKVVNHARDWHLAHS